MTPALSIYSPHVANDADVWPERFNERDEDAGAWECYYGCGRAVEEERGICEKCMDTEKRYK